MTDRAATESTVPGDIPLDIAVAYLTRVTNRLKAGEGPQNAPLVAVLNHIGRYVEATRRDIAALRSADGSPASFATVADELAEVVAESARATNEILSAAEAIQALDGTAANRADAVTKATSRIMVACAFQDITGQRIAKVIRTLKAIETTITSLATACGDAAKGAPDAAAPDPAVADADAGLLNGPQLGDKAQTQDDIDRLFDSA